MTMTKIGTSMRLNSRQIKFIQPMVVYRWYAYHEHLSNTKKAFWENNPKMPVRIGPVMASLVNAGIVERVDGLFGRGVVVYRVSHDVRNQFLCNCLQGKLVGDDGHVIGTCPHCFLGCRWSPTIEG